jgi:NADH:ubiquinone oxidoreductase subunit 5 (subunit L)/multisubunit Na+/H+ antiporter MnhA subunit
LVSHAFFKALLFISIGIIIFNSNSYQDLRFTKTNYKSLPFSFIITLSRSLRLIGFPFISGFFSKEIILEMLITKNLNFIIYFLIIIGILLTSLYRIRLMFILFFSFQPYTSLYLNFDKNFLSNLSIIILLVPAISITPLLVLNINSSPIFSIIRYYEKFIPIFLIFIRIIIFKISIYNITYYFNLKF